jgi:hypothetical protein
MCHCDAYTDQALAAAAASICIIMDQTAKIRALKWCIAGRFRRKAEILRENPAILGELGAR